MYEFHCWVVIRNQEIDKAGERGQIDDRESNLQFQKVLKRLIEKLNEKPGGIADDLFKLVESNGSTTLHFSGLLNHAGPNAINILEWIKTNAPYSYGLLYVHDDENPERPDDFVVYRLAKNKITKLTDAYLSPYCEAVDDLY